MGELEQRAVVALGREDLLVPGLQLALRNPARRRLGAPLRSRRSGRRRILLENLVEHAPRRAYLIAGASRLTQRSVFAVTLAEYGDQPAAFWARTR
jgi:hypothetical protein